MLLLAFMFTIQKEYHVPFINVHFKEIPQCGAEEIHITQCLDQFQPVAPI